MRVLLADWAREQRPLDGLHNLELVLHKELVSLLPDILEDDCDATTSITCGTEALTSLSSAI